MLCTQNQAVRFFAGLACVLFTLPVRGQETNARERAYLRVYVPADARIEIDNAKMQQTGSVRRFYSPPLPAGKRFLYTVKATWMSGTKEIVRKQDVEVMAGREATVVFDQNETRHTADIGLQPRRP